MKMGCLVRLLSPETIKLLLYPFIGLYAALKLAKFHFEKDIKRQYLLAKDKVATDIIDLSGWCSECFFTVPKNLQTGTKKRNICDF